MHLKHRKWPERIFSDRKRSILNRCRFVKPGAVRAWTVTAPTTLNSLSPGLRVAPAGGGNAFYFIRGVGNFTSASFADPAVAVNLDNVYIGRPVATTGPFYDLERVEVVKGPQGTLYGRNATGGAINVVPEKPQLDIVSGCVNASYGSYDAYDVEGAVNAPIGSFSAVRISGAFLGHNGYLSDGTQDRPRVHGAGGSGTAFDLILSRHKRLSHLSMQTRHRDQGGSIAS